MYSEHSELADGVGGSFISSLCLLAAHGKRSYTMLPSLLTCNRLRRLIGTPAYCSTR